MAVERRLTELVGPVGGKLHTARSRNDQVATDVAMFTRDARAAARRGDRGAAWPRWSTPPRRTSTGRCPATRTCSAPSRSTSRHHLLAYFWMLERDRARFASPPSATAALPLGAGALAGVNFDTDRGAVARELGFARRRAELDRRGLQPRLRARLPRRRRHLRDAPVAPRRRARAVVERRSSASVELSDAWASGSSIMPQKKNPDAAELLRAKAPRVVGHLAALHGVMHGLPLTYNKDLQEDKEHLFDAVDTLELCLAAAARDARRRRASAASAWPPPRPTS